jgi:hypothetical protein
MVQSWELVAFKVHQKQFLFIFISWRKKSPKLWKLSPLKNDVLRKRTLHIFDKPLLPKLMNDHKSQSISFKTLNKKKFFLNFSQTCKNSPWWIYLMKKTLVWMHLKSDLNNYIYIYNKEGKVSQTHLIRNHSKLLFNLYVPFTLGGNYILS